MHTYGRVSSIAALLLALGASATAHADPVLPAAGSAAANPVPSGGIMMAAPTPPAAPLPPKLPVLVNADALIPTNGSLLLDARGATTSVMIWLEEGGSRIDGTVRVLDTFLVWTPSSALTPGALYTLNVASPGGAARDKYPVNVGPEIELSRRPPVSAMLRLERVESMATPKCCSSIPGFPVRSSACFSTETKSAVRMRGALSSTATPSNLTQFMFRFKRAGDTAASGPIGFTPLSGIQPLLWTEPEDEEEFCAELSAMEIRNGRIFDYEDLEGCPSADALGDLSPRPIPLDSARVLSHTICSVPPRDLETEWCDTNEVDCSGSPLTAGCENWNHLCQGGPTPVPAGAGGGKRPPVGTVNHPTPAPQAEDTRDDAGFGCSVRQRGGGSGLAAISCVFAWLLLATRRRSARRVSAR